MTDKQLFTAIGSVDEDLVEAAEAASKSRPSLRLVVTKWATAAACVALLAGLGISQLANTGKPQLTPVPQAREGVTVAFESPMGMRKFLNYNGYRYVFSGDGEAYDFSGFALDNSLGILEHDILAGIGGAGNADAELDYAATFALGGTLYEIPGYNPAFRLAVELDDQYYLAELVGRVDGEPLGASYYFAVSNMESLAQSVHVLDHMGGNVLHTFSKSKDAGKIVSQLSQANPAQLVNEEYEAVARAQSEGRSWQLEIRLADGTAVRMYTMPDLGLISIGDDYYRLPDEFLNQYGGVFSGLSQDSPPFAG